VNAISKLSLVINQLKTVLAGGRRRRRQFSTADGEIAVGRSYVQLGLNEADMNKSSSFLIY